MSFLDPDQADDPVRTIFSAYEPMFSLPLEEIPEIGQRIPLPRFPSQLLQDFISSVHETIRSSSALLIVTSPCFIIGDIHGNIHDLFRIFASIPDPLTHQYLFLGDYVDRGHYSLDVFLVLFTLFLTYQGRFWFLRGNHELSSVNEKYGFRDELQERYGNDTLWSLIGEQIFQFLPLGALLNGSILCIHGGIGPGIETIGDIRRIKLPLATADDDNVQAVLWADPHDTFPLFGPSARGAGCAFGSEAVRNFLNTNGLQYLIRAHQCVKHGVSYFAERCITVFSTSNYGKSDNAAGFIHIDEDGEISEHILERQRFVGRAEAHFAVPEVRKRRPPVHVGSFQFRKPELPRRSHDWTKSGLLIGGSRKISRSASSADTNPLLSRFLSRSYLRT